jgi:hypothetical protein
VEIVLACIYVEKSLKIFFSRTTEPKKIRFTWKLYDIMQSQVYSNHGPQGW